MTAVDIKVFVEGAGTDSASRTLCREGFSRFFRKLIQPGLRQPRIVASGPRDQAHSDFCAALRQPNMLPILLVDAEAPVKGSDWWLHVRNRPGDRWPRPDGVSDEQLLLMVQCMESWFVADPATLERFYGQGFQASALPRNSDVGSIDKALLASSLKQATRNTRTKGEYHKVRHGLVLVGEIDPVEVMKRSPELALLRGRIEALLRRT